MFLRCFAFFFFFALFEISLTVYPNKKIYLKQNNTNGQFGHVIHGFSPFGTNFHPTDVSLKGDTFMIRDYYGKPGLSVLRMECSLEYDGPVNGTAFRTWFHNGTALRVDYKHFEMLTNWTVQINNVRWDDAGQWSCLAEERYSEANNKPLAYAWLNMTLRIRPHYGARQPPAVNGQPSPSILRGPYFVEPPPFPTDRNNQSQVILSPNATSKVIPLPCKVDGNPAPLIRWYQYYHLLPYQRPGHNTSDERRFSREILKYRNQTVFPLNISTVPPIDETPRGAFPLVVECRAHNDLGLLTYEYIILRQVNQPKELDVGISPRYPKPQHVQVGDRFNFVCKATNRKFINDFMIYWFNGTDGYCQELRHDIETHEVDVVPLNRSHELSWARNKNYVTVEHALPGMQGEYCCVFVVDVVGPAGSESGGRFVDIGITSLKLFGLESSSSAFRQAMSSGTIVALVCIVLLIVAVLVFAACTMKYCKRTSDVSERKVVQIYVRESEIYVSSNGQQRLQHGVVVTAELRPRRRGEPTDLAYALESDASWEIDRRHLVLYEKIGSGAFGEVFKAELHNSESPTGRLAAVKMLKENSSLVELQDLVEEMENLKRIRPHINVIRLLHVCTSGGPLMVVMEYADHGSLLQFLRKQANRLRNCQQSTSSGYRPPLCYRPTTTATTSNNWTSRPADMGSTAQTFLPAESYAPFHHEKAHDVKQSLMVELPAETPPRNAYTILNGTPTDSADQSQINSATLTNFCLQMAHGLEHLHSNGYIHRDLAARNCLVSTGVDGQLVIKIADFGLTRVLQREKDYYRKTSRSRVPIKWMAPESIIDSRYDFSTDMWSFGVTMWEIFTLGQSPYPDVEQQNLIDFLTVDNRRLSKPRRASTTIYDLMRACWHLNPVERPCPQTAADLLARASLRNAENDDSSTTVTTPDESTPTGADKAVPPAGVVPSQPPCSSPPPPDEPPPRPPPTVGRSQSFPAEALYLNVQPVGVDVLEPLHCEMVARHGPYAFNNLYYLEQQSESGLPTSELAPMTPGAASQDSHEASDSHYGSMSQSAGSHSDGSVGASSPGHRLREISWSSDQSRAHCGRNGVGTHQDHFFPSHDGQRDLAAVPNDLHDSGVNMHHQERPLQHWDIEGTRRLPDGAFYARPSRLALPESRARLDRSSSVRPGQPSFSPPSSPSHLTQPADRQLVDRQPSTLHRLGRKPLTTFQPLAYRSLNRAGHPTISLTAVNELPSERTRQVVVTNV